MEILDKKFLNVGTETCHAPTVAFYKDKLVFAWFGGTREAHPDTAIYIQKDEEVIILGDRDLIPRWNPILFVYKDRLFLFIKAGIYCDCWQTLIYDISKIFEQDFDIKKIKPQLLPAGLNGPVKCKPIIGKYNDFIYCGSSVETFMNWTAYVEEYDLKGNQFRFIGRSVPLSVVKKIKDNYGNEKTGLGIIQPSLWKDDYGFNAFFRSAKGLGKIYYSQFLYNRWTEPIPTIFDNPSASIDTVFYDRKLFLVYNPSQKIRMPIVINKIESMGFGNFEIKDELVVEKDVEGKTYTPELSYPFMIENQSQFHLVFSYGRSKIEYCQIKI